VGAQFEVSKSGGMKMYVRPKKKGVNVRDKEKDVMRTRSFPPTGVGSESNSVPNTGGRAPLFLGPKFLSVELLWYSCVAKAYQ
jgi:hypothetical protein